MAEFPAGPPYKLYFEFSDAKMLEALDEAYPDDEYPELRGLHDKARRAWADAYRKQTESCRSPRD